MAPPRPATDGGRMRTFRTALALLLLSAAPAAAQEPVGPAAAPFPALATLDHVTDHSSFNSSLALSFYGDNGPDYGARWDLFGQFVTQQGLGGYVALPVSYAAGEGESESGVGNLEAGGVYIAPAGPSTDVVLRGGLALDTAGDEDGFLNLYTFVPRMTDLPSATSEITWLRFSASPLHRSGNLFVRADVGLDLAIDEPDGSDVDPFFHVNVAVGVETSGVTVAGELVTVGFIGDDDDDELLHTLALSVGGEAGGVRPYGALILPVENEIAEDFLDLSLAIMGGIEVPIGAR
jgi:hypothetical protein